MRTESVPAEEDGDGEHAEELQCTGGGSRPRLWLGEASGMQEPGTREAISILTLLHSSPCGISVSVIKILCYKHSWLNHMVVYSTF